MPHPPIGIEELIGSDDDAPFTFAAAGTLNCFSMSIDPHDGHFGTSRSLRTRVSNVDSQGSQRYSEMGMAIAPNSVRRTSVL